MSNDGFSLFDIPILLFGLISDLLVMLATNRYSAFFILLAGAVCVGVGLDRRQKQTVANIYKSIFDSMGITDKLNIENFKWLAVRKIDSVMKVKIATNSKIDLGTATEIRDVPLQGGDTVLVRN